MVAPCNIRILPLSFTGGPTLLGSPFRLGVLHQTRMLTPLPEVHAPRNPGPDRSGLVDAQRLRENDLGEDEGSLGVTTPTENPPLFCCQDSRKSATYRSGGRDIPAR